MGEVYRARDVRIGRDVALKILPRSASTDPDRLHRFEKEACAAGALNHPNLLTIYDVGTHEGCPYIVSELLEGETLRERMRGGALPPHKAINYALQIAHGLATAHDREIVHRDLKPENIFVTKDGRIKILDFGLVKLLQSPNKKSGQTGLSTVTLKTDPGKIIGTVGYMSPEQVRSQPVCHRSDIFSFGIILYEILCGARPFQRATSVETLNAILNDDPPKLAELNDKFSPELVRILKRCLEKNPQERFQSASDLAFHLESLSVLSGSSAERRAIAIRGDRRKIWLLALAVGLLATLAVGSFFLGRTSARVAPPSFQQLTFRHGTLQEARFAPDGQTVYYSAWWESKESRVFWTRPGSPESSTIDLPEATLLSISSAGEMAILLRPTEAQDVRGTLARVPLAGGAPREMLDDVQWADWSPDGKQLVVVREIERLSQLEYPIGTILFKTSGALLCPRVSPSGDQIAFLHRQLLGDGGGAVVVVDRAGATRTLSDGWASILGLAWSPAGDEIWFTAAKVGGNRALYAVSLAGETRLVARLPNRLTLTDISRDGRVLLSRESFQGGMMFMPAGGSRERSLDWFDGSLGSDLSDDGQKILFVERREASATDYTTYLRKTDGSSAMRLGEGFATDLSPDGKWALSITRGSPAQISLLPTGTGEQRQLTNGAINHLYSADLNYIRALWLNTGERILFSGNEPNKGVRCFVQDIRGGSARPITPEGVQCLLISPDDKFAAGIDSAQKVSLYPVEGGDPVEVQGLAPREVPIQWSADGRSLYVHEPRGTSAKIFRLNLSTGRKEFWKEIVPPSTTGLIYFGPILLTPDGRSYAYSYGLNQSDLYLVEGLK